MFEVYSVAIRVSLVNQVTGGLLGISQALRSTDADAKRLKATLGDIKMLVMGGAITAGVGAFGLGLIGKTLPDAKEYAHQLAQMNIAGMKQAEIARSISAAWALNKTVPTSTAAQNLEAIRELRTVFGDTQEAINFLPVSQRLSYILQNTKGGDAKGETQALARALDLRNATTTTASAQAQADMMMKAIVASGGVLSATDFNQTFKYGRTATLGWSNEFAYTILPSLMQELKSGRGSGAGGGPGNPLMSAYATVVQGAVPMKALGVWQELGLLDPDKVVRTKTGLTKGLRPGAITASDVFIENPYLWTQTILKPALVRAGYDTEKEQRQAMGYLFPNRTAGAVMTTMLFQNRAIERDRRMIGIAQGMSAYESLMKNDPRAADAALAAQWKNLMAVIGFEILPVLVPLTLKLVDGLRSMTNWAKENPKAVRNMTLAFAGLSAALTFGGTVMIVAGAVKALGLALNFLGVTRLFTMARGVTALGSASTLFPTMGEAMLGFAGVIARVAGILGGIVALGFVGKDILKNLGGAAGVAGIAMSNRSKEDKDLATARMLYKDGAVGDDTFNRIAGRAATARGGSPYIALGANGKGAAAGGNVYMDGRKVGDLVSERQAKAMGHTAAVGRQDAGASIPNPGVPYAR